MSLDHYDIDKNNLPMRYAYELIANTNTSFFLTGRAGTGKTTFIRNVLDTVDKKFAVLAPTGIAALNANGKTIHHFFGFPLSVLGPNEYGKMPKKYIEVIKGNPIIWLPPVDTIIIDEVSMVRCDLMDGIDRMLRSLKETTVPFGGIQMVFVGDLFQLSPVVTDSDHVILSEIYGNKDYHFFSAHCIDADTFPKIELEFVYRQEDKAFVSLLENVRLGKADRDDIGAINSRIQPDWFQDEEDDELFMNLCSYRNDAEKINDAKLALLESEPKTYEAIYEGDCEGYEDVIEKYITLKVGAQVVFIKNGENDQWANGTMAIVTGMDDDKIRVVLETGEPIEVERVKWEISDLVYDRLQRKTIAKVRGYISQFPLKVAWAITIHKSQSMTYSRARIDFGRGAFCEGQAYVALSRLKSLDGLIMAKPFKESSIIVSPAVLDFSSNVNDYQRIITEIEIAELIDDALENDDVETATNNLFEKIITCARDGDVEKAYELICRLYLLLIDDRPLYCFDCPTVQVHTGKDTFVRAFLLFYAGDAENAMNILSQDSIDEANTFNTLYLRMRCYEYLGQWDSFDDVLGDLILLCESEMEDNSPSSHHRKVLWTILLHWERVNRPTWIGAIKSLLGDISFYDELFNVVRNIALADPTTARFLREEGGEFADVLCEETSSEDDIEEAVEKVRTKVIEHGVASDNEDMCRFLSACSRLK